MLLQFAATFWIFRKDGKEEEREEEREGGRGKREGWRGGPVMVFCLQQNLPVFTMKTAHDHKTSLLTFTLGSEATTKVSSLKQLCHKTQLSGSSPGNTGESPGQM